MEMHIKQFKPGENALAKRSEAIALFEQSHHLVLFNQNLVDIWGLSPDWLKKQPHFQLFFAEIVKYGYWSEAQVQQLVAALESTESESVSLYIEQTNGIYLEVCTSVTSDKGHW